MKHSTIYPHAQPRATTIRTRREALLGLLACSSASMWLSACGGGGGSVAGVTSGGTGAFSLGAITGLGSIIVNGVRYDDSSASISDDDGRTLSRSDLQIGVVVGVQTTTPVSGTSATASRITAISSELKGPIDSIDLANSRFTVLGQTVLVNAATVFELGLSGLSALAVNNLVQVHGFTDAANNTVQASRIERKSNLAEYRLTGRVANLTGTTFQIGSLSISFAAADVRVAPANGLTLRVRLQPTPASGTRTATRIQAAEDGLNVPTADLSGEIEGTITSFTSINAFRVNGVSVVTTSSTVYRDGTAGIVLGARVEVKGSLLNSVLTATLVKIEDSNQADENELFGSISALNTTAKTFVVRGITVDYSPAGIEFRDGLATDLANGRQVEVKGRLQAATGQLLASRIKFES